MGQAPIVDFDGDNPPDLETEVPDSSSEIQESTSVESETSYIDDEEIIYWLADKNINRQEEITNGYNIISERSDRIEEDELSEIAENSEYLETMGEEIYTSLTSEDPCKQVHKREIRARFLENSEQIL